MKPKTTKLIARIIAIVLTIILVITTFSFVSYWGAGKGAVYGAANDEYLDRQFSTLRRAITDIQTNYKDEVKLETLVTGAFSGVLEALQDPYSTYYTAEEAIAFTQSVSGEFSGIGVTLEDSPGGCRVVAPLTGSPAALAGIRSGDQIVRVGDKDVTRIKGAEVAALLKGEVGTTVSLEVLRQGGTLKFTVTRAMIKTASVEFNMLADKIGYIAIQQFDNDTQLEFKNAKLQLITQGATRFIVDIRDNPGGFISGATDVAGQFMPAGPITHLERRGQIVETISTSGEASPKMAVVLLVNHGSASAAEILAGAWQDSHTAKLVGTATYGKGVAQQVHTLANGGTVKLSEFYFLTPNKNPIHQTGLAPDYLVINPAEDKIAALTERYSRFAPMTERSKAKAGTTGLNVYGAQQRLQLLEYNVKTTGTMDPATVTAVKAFQKSAGLYPYGILDYATMAALDRTIGEQLLTLASKDDLQLKKAIELLN